MSTATSSPPTRDWRLWWYARLESTIKASDRQGIQEALRNLARLGVEVRFTLPPDLDQEKQARPPPAPEGRRDG
jgi:hypothetical protein